MQSAQLQISADTVKLSGALIFTTVNQLWRTSQNLFTHRLEPLRFDLQDVTQSDSAGVALLLAWVRKAHSDKKNIIFLSLPKQMRAIAKVSGLENILPVAQN